MDEGTKDRLRAKANRCHELMFDVRRHRKCARTARRQRYWHNQFDRLRGLR